MDILSIQQLNNQFAFNNANNSLCFVKGPADIPVIEIQNQHAQASISLQGAHLIRWSPTGEDEVIWLSDQARYALGKSIRGGIPICWPWFGAHKTDASYPAHGFARTRFWQVESTQALSSGATEIIFKLDTDKMKGLESMWPWAICAEYRLLIAKNLKLELVTTNNSNQVITLGQALHTYFNVGDIDDTQVYGLEDRDYLDKTDHFKRKTQQGPIIINKEVDRVYLNTGDEVVIDNKKRKIHISKQGSQSSVVWNPWHEVAEKMGDLGVGGYRTMLCVESANAADDVVRIEPGQHHTLSVAYQLE